MSVYTCIHSCEANPVSSCTACMQAPFTHPLATVCYICKYNRSRLHLNMYSSGADMHFSMIKHTFTHRNRLRINTQQPCVCTLVHATGPFYACTCPCLHMYKPQAPFKQIQPVGPVRMYVHNQQASFKYVQASGSVYMYTHVCAVYIACRSLFTSTHIRGCFECPHAAVQFTHAYTDLFTNA